MFELMYRSPVEMQLDSVAAELFSRVREGRVKRVVIDAIGDLKKSSADKQRFSDFMYALTQWFATQNVTCLLLYEVHNLFDPPQISDEEISNMSDNIILLSFSRDAENGLGRCASSKRAAAHTIIASTFWELDNSGVAIQKAS